MQRENGRRPSHLCGVANGRRRHEPVLRNLANLVVDSFKRVNWPAASSSTKANRSQGRDAKPRAALRSPGCRRDNVLAWVSTSGAETFSLGLGCDDTRHNVNRTGFFRGTEQARVEFRFGAEPGRNPNLSFTRCCCLSAGCRWKLTPRNWRNP